eukprot:COSAG06_NODE_20589_length_789_cov_0.908696_1_plen_160_part_00
MQCRPIAPLSACLCSGPCLRPACATGRGLTGSCESHAMTRSPTQPCRTSAAATTRQSRRWQPPIQPRRAARAAPLRAVAVGSAARKWADTHRRPVRRAASTSYSPKTGRAHRKRPLDLSKIGHKIGQLINYKIRLDLYKTNSEWINYKIRLDLYKTNSE